MVVGGTARKVGKTSVVCGIIAGLRDWNWTAVKLTPHQHAHSRPHSNPDSARYLQAGAVRSYWIRTPAGAIERALPLLNRILDEGGNVIIESNGAIDLLTPDLALMVVGASVSDLKPTSLRFLECTDAFVQTAGDVPAAATAGRPRFEAFPPAYTNRALLAAIRLKNPLAPADSTCR